MTASLKAAGQALLRRIGLYERIKGSRLYHLYWSVADRSFLEHRARELAFFRKTLVGFKRGDLIFDIGANQGLKTGIFLEMGARVVAVDPDASNQHALEQRFLAYRLRKKPLVVLGKAISDRNGLATFWVSEPGFEMNTLSEKWVEKLGTDPARFGRTHEFREKREVETITLEEMISRHGRPFYIKVDVEGYEPEALAGLQTPVPFLSFEVNLPDFKTEGLRCIDRLQQVAADGVFNYATGADGLALPEWEAHENFARTFAGISETSVEVWWRTSPAR